METWNYYLQKISTKKLDIKGNIAENKLNVPSSFCLNFRKLKIFRKYRFEIFLKKNIQILKGLFGAKENIDVGSFECLDILQENLQ